MRILPRRRYLWLLHYNAKTPQGSGVGDMYFENDLKAISTTDQLDTLKAYIAARVGQGTSIVIISVTRLGSYLDGDRPEGVLSFRPKEFPYEPEPSLYIHLVRWLRKHLPRPS